MEASGRMGVRRYIKTSYRDGTLDFQASRNIVSLNEIVWRA